jgi:predicted aldo/keto reductase-like oxidoreductase
MPCPSGVNIPQNFALLNNKSVSATKLMSKSIQWMITANYHKLARSNKQLLTKKNNGRASLCSKCNACISKCPQQIKIPTELEKVTAAFEKRRIAKPNNQ